MTAAAWAQGPQAALPTANEDAARSACTSAQATTSVPLPAAIGGVSLRGRAVAASGASGPEETAVGTDEQVKLLPPPAASEPSNGQPKQPQD
uniref:Uncharacterized protein n=1 Tax=Globodera rostochiensis TaxID=31243 RepID=A0A914HRN0_GLORO